MAYKNNPWRPKLPKPEGDPIEDWQALLMLIGFVVVMTLIMMR